jgi:multicomponent Na+:H+ antiporter subunit D
MNLFLVLPLVVPAAAAAISLLVGTRVVAQRLLAVASTAALLAAAVALLASVLKHDVLASQMGGWPAPFGITLVADILSALMVVVTGVIGLAVAVYSLSSIDRGREQYGYYTFFHVLLMGVCGAFLTGDLFNLYVWFEVMLMASFVLLALGGEPDQLRGAIKYVTMNLLASAVFLAAAGILYGIAGTLNMADLARLAAASTDPTPWTATAMLFLVAFGIKSAVFPLFFWLPASYHTPPIPVAAVFAGLLTKVGVYSLLRVFTLIFVHDVGYTHTLLLVAAGFTMLTGVLGAASQHDIRRILSFHIISQIGYMIMGLGLAGMTDSPAVAAAALAGSVFYIAHHIIVKTNLFLVGGVARRFAGSYELKELGGLYRSYPLLAVLFAVPALSLAGMPPLSGFFAKLSLVRAGLAMDQFLITGVALFVGLLTLFSMTKIWAEAFWKSPLVERQTYGRVPASMLLPIAALAVMTVGIGIAAGPLFELAARAAGQLVDRGAYMSAVLGD